MRSPLPKKPEKRGDAKYNSPLVTQLINYVMWDGKKSVAQKIVYEALEILAKKAGSEEPIMVFKEALKNVGPLMEVRSRRVGGANYQVPREVRQERRVALSYRWIIAAARSRKGVPMASALGEELFLASKGEGEAIKKRDNTHRMAEANKAFAHFAY